MRQGPTLLVLLLLTSLCSGCLSFDHDESKTIRLATTTSMRDSGLLDLLIDDFQRTSDYTVEYVAVGTGAALILGENKDVDALIVHSPEQETDVQFKRKYSSAALIIPGVNFHYSKNSSIQHY